ncbi:MAG TPA: substrate-binding domain-containing protein [Anaerolineae bacterium]|nr:substrate-binding domain-containing protein [Anaerolineae bacterium]
MEKKGGTVSITTLIISLIAVAVVVGSGVYFLIPKAAPAETPTDGETVDTDVIPKYDLDVETAYYLTMERHAFLDWGHNAPNIHEYRVEAPFTIGYITSWRGNPWQEVNIAEFTREAERSALIEDFVHMDSAGSVDTQINNLRDMFTMWRAGDLDGIIVDPLDPMALVDTIEEIYDAGCPIILFNDSADTTKYTSFVSDDPWTYGTAGAQWLVDTLGGEGKILFFRGLQAYPIDDARSGGALAVFEQYPDIEIAAIEYADWSYDLAKTVFMDMVAAVPEFDGIYSVGGQMSLAIIDAMIELDMDPGLYPHASEDQNGFLQKAIEYNIPAFASTHPSITSAISVRLMEMLLQGYPVPKVYFFPTPVITDDQFVDYVRPDAPEGIFVFTPLSDAECVAACE